MATSVHDLDLPEVSLLPQMAGVEGRLASPAFTPRATDRLRPFMRKVVNELVGRLRRRRVVRAGGRRLRALPDPTGTLVMTSLALDGPIEWKPATVGIWGPSRLPLRFSTA